MDKYSDLIIRHRKRVILVFLLAALAGAALWQLVHVNYSLTDYLPEKAQSTVGLDIMDREFAQAVPNASVMVRDVSVPEALEIKRQLLQVEGVSDVMWLDDAVDIRQPLAMQDGDTVESFYKDGNALYSLTVEKGAESAACSAIRTLIGPDVAIAGEAANYDAMQSAAGSEVLHAVAILVPAIILLLILSTSSWVEPLLFLAAVGMSVLINMGTNIFFGEVSFVTNAVGPILQLAVSLDYAVFLLHSFNDYRQSCATAAEAMRKAMRASVTTVAASASTTLFGFLALVFMDFKVGADLGICLAKGIVLSFVCVMVFLPALTLGLYKLIDKTRHRPLMPDFGNIGRVLSRFFLPAAALVALLIIPSFLGQGQTNFIYGYGADDPSRDIGRSSIAIKEEFGQTTIMALLVPRGDVVRERDLSSDLGELPRVKSVLSFANTVGTSVPADFLSRDITDRFYSENYARIIVYTDTPEEGTLAFQTVEDINAVVLRYYDDFYSVGQSTNLNDMKNVVAADNTRINLIAVIAIFLVLLVTFRSATLPFLLLLTIEAGIWINLSIPYFTGVSINFIGYLVLSTVQLGATVDYAILLTDTYLGNRRRMPLKAAIAASLNSAFRSILVSASILSIAGFTLFLTSSNPIVGDIGLLLGRGTLLSVFMVVCLLPALLTLFDKAIAKTTRGANFFRGKLVGRSGPEAPGEKERALLPPRPDEIQRLSEGKS